MISFAEHNGHYAAAYKTCKIGQLVSIALCFLISQRCTCLLLQALVVRSPCLLPLPLQRLSLGKRKASVSVPSFYDNFDREQGVVTKPEIVAELKAAVAKLSA